MNFDTGLIDRLLGKRIEITTTTASGPKSVWVTEKWFAKMVAEGKITPDDASQSTQQAIRPNANEATRMESQRTEIPIEDAVSVFLNAIRKHVESNWQNRAAQLPDILPTADSTLVGFAQGDVSKILMIHAMFAVELRDARRTYPAMLLAQVESLSLNTIRANMGGAGEQFAAITEKFLTEFDDAAEGNFDPILGVGLAMSNFIQVNTSQTLSPDIHLELSKAMFAVATSLKQEWWATFASRMKLEVGA